MTHVVFALGSNLGDRRAHIEEAIQALRASAGIEIENVSALYETEPVGGPEQDNYLNAVVTAESHLDPHELLRYAHDIENAHNRTREVRWGARTLDIDLIVVGDQVIDDETLTLPHPRAYERAFVLVPWSTIDPDCQIPGHGTVSECLSQLETDGVWLSQTQMSGGKE